MSFVRVKSERVDNARFVVDKARKKFDSILAQRGARLLFPVSVGCALRAGFEGSKSLESRVSSLESSNNVSAIIASLHDRIWSHQFFVV